MTPSELKVFKILFDKGYKILTRGWPDFLCIKNVPGGLSAIAVEVKNGYDKLTEEQKACHHILIKLGIPVYTVRTDSIENSKSLRGKLLFEDKNIKSLREEIERLKYENSNITQYIKNLENSIKNAEVLFDTANDYGESLINILKNGATDDKTETKEPTTGEEHQTEHQEVS